jgi:hypothetical protein
MNVEIKERYETSEPEQVLVLEGPYWGFKVKESKIEKFKEDLDKLQDKLANTDIKVFAFVSAGLFAIVPKQGKGNADFSVKELMFQETLDAIVEKLYAKIEFNPEQKQKKLEE